MDRAEREAGAVAMHMGNIPPKHLRPWFGAGEVAERLPAVVAAYIVRIPPIDPAEEPAVQCLGAVGQPTEEARNSAFETYRQPETPMSEATLIRAHRQCTCYPQSERMPWEDWTPEQRQRHERRQRVMAQRTLQREERAKQGGA